MKNVPGKKKKKRMQGRRQRRHAVGGVNKKK